MNEIICKHCDTSNDSKSLLCENCGEGLWSNRNKQRSILKKESNKTEPIENIDKSKFNNINYGGLFILLSGVSFLFNLILVYNFDYMKQSDLTQIIEITTLLGTMGLIFLCLGGFLLFVHKSE